MAFPQVETLVDRQLRNDTESVVFGFTPAITNDADPLRPLIDFVTPGFVAAFHVTRKTGNRPAT